MTTAPLQQKTRQIWLYNQPNYKMKGIIMEKFRLEFHLGNAMFEDLPIQEIARILHLTASDIENGYTSRTIFDINGNRIGMWAISP